MNGYDIQEWNRCQEIADEYEISLEAHGDKILMKTKGLGYIDLGVSNSVHECLCYLHGYSVSLVVYEKESDL